MSNNEEDYSEVVELMKSLVLSPSRQRIRNEMRDKIKHIEDIILNGTSKECNENKYNEYDLLRKEREALMEFLEIPDDIITRYTAVEV